MINNWQEWLNQPQKLETHRKQRGLDRISALLKILGNPEKTFRSIHVAGTNGKGSVCAILSQILFCNGTSVGRYTSPHLQKPVERIWINGNNISYDEWKKLGDEVFLAAKSCIEWPSPFEFMTAMGFLAFARARVDIAVIEVGMGGRLDATNVISPFVTVITSIGRDHCNILGKTSAAIVKEKAGIIKKTVPVICGPLPHGIFQVIKEQAKTFNVPVIKANSVQICKRENTLTRFIARDKEWETILQGEYQRINLGIVFAVLSELQNQGIKVSDSAIKEGLLNVRWPGRFEIISESPKIILDGAHNPNGMKVLVDSLNSLKVTGSKVMLLGIQEDKEAEKMLKTAKRWATCFVLTKGSSIKALNPEKLCKLLGEYKGDVFVADNLQEAISRLFSISESTNCLVITGSLYLIGEAREILLDILDAKKPKEGSVQAGKINR